MKIEKTNIQGLLIAESSYFSDERGAFSRLFCRSELQELIGQRNVVQINQSKTILLGAVRGLHYQLPPNAEMKLVRCIKGSVWDVAVDIRKDSPTKFRWFAQKLSPENRKTMIIPEGFAHGFQVLEPESELLYLHTEFFTPAAEAGLNPLDPVLAIEWPLIITQLSERDSCHEFVNKEFNGINL